VKTADAPARLIATLAIALPTMARVLHDPWWIIGSAAMRLGGIANVEPADVDLLCSAGDADRLMAVWQDHLDTAYRPRDDDRFRSRFARFHHLPMPVEVMGDLQVHVEAGWLSVCVDASQSVRCGEHTVSIPSWQEQIRILRLFGRDKDMVKADLISSYIETEHAHVG
jgi:hypothetical protein